MNELVAAIDDITALVNTAIETLILGLTQVVSTIGNEIGAFIVFLTYGFDAMLCELVNILVDYSEDSWYSPAATVESFSLYMYNIAIHLVGRINDSITQFTQFTTAIMLAIQQDLADIDNNVTAQYQQRVFAIYGRIGALSIAIDTSPSYLEDAIQNAKFFVLGVSGYVGLSYDKFQLDWDTGLTNLLNRIAGSISLYKANPQQIKLDLEVMLVRPAFDIMSASRLRRDNQVNALDDQFGQLNTEIQECRQSIIDNQHYVDDLWELIIEPELKRLAESFDSWVTNIYNERVDWVDNSLGFLARMAGEHRAKLDDIYRRLSFAGDILESIDLLPESQRSEQEHKIAEVSTRVFRDNADLWSAFVTSKRET